MFSFRLHGDKNFAICICLCSHSPVITQSDFHCSYHPLPAYSFTYFSLHLLISTSDSSFLFLTLVSEALPCLLSLSIILSLQFLFCNRIIFFFAIHILFSSSSSAPHLEILFVFFVLRVIHFSFSYLITSSFFPFHIKASPIFFHSCLILLTILLSFPPSTCVYPTNFDLPPLLTSFLHLKPHLSFINLCTSSSSIASLPSSLLYSIHVSSFHSINLFFLPCPHSNNIPRVIFSSFHTLTHNQPFSFPDHSSLTFSLHKPLLPTSFHFLRVPPV